MFPILTVRTKEKGGDVCWFYREGRCAIQEVKPLTCRLYPMNIQPDDRDGIEYVLVSQRQHHYTGAKIRAGDWIAENMSEDDREFMQWWYKHTPVIGKMMAAISKIPGARSIHLKMRSRVIWYMYLHYSRSSAFWSQFERNMGLLDSELKYALKGKMKFLS
jgi:Fe-S-cluster containining protein